LVDTRAALRDYARARYFTAWPSRNLAQKPPSTSFAGDGYCIGGEEAEAIIADPPDDPDAFLDAVLRAEGYQHPELVDKRDREPLLKVVRAWAVRRWTGAWNQVRVGSSAARLTPLLSRGWFGM
jgi:hypothetical protein